METLFVGVVISSLIGFFTALGMAKERIQTLEKENIILKKRLDGNGITFYDKDMFIEKAQILVNNYLNLKPKM